jgi:N-acetylglucosaminyldiphosphoundecaprenol N-acetyl-beta-D-mannosaminyltransferase
MSSDTRATLFRGISFAHLDLDGATRLLLSPRALATAVPWRLVNTFSVSLMGRRPDYATVLRGDGVNLADGKPLAWALRAMSRRAGSPTLPEHIRGPAFFERVLDEGRARGIRHYLLGGSPETLAQLQAVIEERFPGAWVVGAWSPPFRPLTREEQVAQDGSIRASRADLVWVGLGTPRQDAEAERLAQSVGIPAIGIGAAFDFLAGTKPEAPVWMQRAALEWLFRFASEPRRLWHRYTVGLVQFALVAVRELARRPVIIAAPERPIPLQPAAGLIQRFLESERVGA